MGDAKRRKVLDPEYGKRRFPLVTFLDEKRTVDSYVYCILAKSESKNRTHVVGKYLRYPEMFDTKKLKKKR